MISLLEHSTCRVCVSTLGTGRSGKGRTPQLDPAPDIKRKMLAPKPHGLRLRATDICGRSVGRREERRREPVHPEGIERLESLENMGLLRWLREPPLIELDDWDHDRVCDLKQHKSERAWSEARKMRTEREKVPRRPRVTEVCSPARCQPGCPPHLNTQARTYRNDIFWVRLGSVARAPSVKNAECATQQARLAASLRRLECGPNSA